MRDARTVLRPAGDAPGSVAIVGGGPAGRRRLTWLLLAAGLRVSTNGTGPDDVTLLVLVEEAAEPQAIRETALRRPGVPILAVVPDGTTNGDLRRVMLAGAAGIVPVADVGRAFGPTARALTAGQLAVPRTLGRQVAPRPLSHREKQILRLVELGLTNAEIARRLFLAESTVKTHLSAAFRKLDVHSRAEAMARLNDPDAGCGPGFLALGDAD